MVLGAGVMGTAFTYPVCDAGHSVVLVGTHLDTAWVEEMRRSRVHPRIGLPLPEQVEPLTYTELGRAFETEPAVVVLGVSSAGIDWAVDTLAPSLPADIPVLLLTKGLATTGTRVTALTDAVADALSNRGVPGVTVGGVGGPCIAAELAARRHTSVVVAFSDEVARSGLRRNLEGPYYHVQTSGDVRGTEACAALKNFFTLAVGAAAGELERWGVAENGAQMHNHAAALFSQAVREMEHLVDRIGGDRRTVYGLAGVGDLYVTCQAGRNSRMGRLLGLGMSYGEAKNGEMPNDTVEGAELGRSVGPALESMMERGELEVDALPLTRALLDVVLRDGELALPWQAFHRRA